jgi:hypothetical protein
MGTSGEKPDAGEKPEAAKKAGTGEKPEVREDPEVQARRLAQGSQALEVVIRGDPELQARRLAQGTHVVPLRLTNDVVQGAVQPGALGTGPQPPKAKGTFQGGRTIEGAVQPPVAVDTEPPPTPGKSTNSLTTDKDPTGDPNDWMLVLLETEADANRRATESSLLALIHARASWEESSKNKGGQDQFADDVREREVLARAALLTEAHAWRRLAVGARLFASRFPERQNHFATVHDRANTHEATASSRLAKGFRPLSSGQSTDQHTPKKPQEEKTLLTATIGQSHFTGLDGDTKEQKADAEILVATLGEHEFLNRPLILLGVLLLILVIVASVYQFPPDEVGGEEIAARALKAAEPFAMIGLALGLVGALLERKGQSSW